MALHFSWLVPYHALIGTQGGQTERPNLQISSYNVFQLKTKILDLGLLNCCFETAEEVSFVCFAFYQIQKD
jgi:hypothetical protein